MNKVIPLSLMGVILATYSFTGIKKENTNITKHLDRTANVIQQQKKTIVKNTKKDEEIDKQKPEEEQLPDTEKVLEEPVIEQEIEENRSIEQEEPKTEENSFYETRLTSYYPNDGPDTGSITGSGLGPSDFEVNDKGWFTYQGKLVIATATDYLISRFGLADGIHTYKYYNELVLNIDGIDYQAIVLDSCGNCMRTGRIDLFVSGAWAVKDTMIEVKE